MWIMTSRGRIELNITKRQAERGYHPGDCEADVLELRKVPAIRRQLDKINPQVLREELGEYGAWEETELQDHDLNLSRILWLMCGYIADGGK